MFNFTLPVVHKVLAVRFSMSAVISVKLPAALTTLNAEVLLAVLLALTVTLFEPKLADVGTVKEMAVDEQFVETFAAGTGTPPNLIVLFEQVVEKFVPAIVTEVPDGP